MCLSRFFLPDILDTGGARQRSQVYQSKSKIFRELVKDGKVPLRKGVVSLIDEVDSS